MCAPPFSTPSPQPCPPSRLGRARPLPYLAPASLPIAKSQSPSGNISSAANASNTTDIMSVAMKTRSGRFPPRSRSGAARPRRPAAKPKRSTLRISSPASRPSPIIKSEKPGLFHKITPADLPKPYATKSSANFPKIVPKPDNMWPMAPAGFKVELYTHEGLTEPRQIRMAPNGDFFVADSMPGEIKIFRGRTSDGKPEQVSTFATGLKRPFGIAFYPVGRQPAMGLRRQYRFGRPHSLSQWRSQGYRRRRKPSSPSFPPAVSIGLATLFSPRTASACSSPSVPAPTSTIPTRIPRSSIAPTFSNTRPRQVRPGLRLWHPQPGRTRHQSRNRRVVVLGQRARRARR